MRGQKGATHRVQERQDLAAGELGGILEVVTALQVVHGVDQLVAQRARKRLLAVQAIAAQYDLIARRNLVVSPQWVAIAGLGRH